MPAADCVVDYAVTPSRSTVGAEGVEGDAITAVARIVCTKGPKGGARPEGTSL